MANELDNLTGKTFGLLTVVERVQNDVFGNVWWSCLCTCGESCKKRASQLREGKFFTCGKKACRFWEKVYKTAGANGCWEWTGALTDSKHGGYGVFKEPGQKKVIRAHVYSWELHYGLIPDGLWVLHECDNRKCVRPGHLFLGDHQANMRDMAEKDRAKGLQKVHLPSEEKNQMRADYKQGGVTHVDLAERFGVSTQTVGRILRGESN